MMWRTLLPFWASALVPSVCLLTMIQKLYFCVNYTFHFFLQVDLQIIRGQTNNLLPFCYNDVKNLSSILSCCNCDNIVPSKKDWKALRQWENNISVILITPPERTNKELIYHLYTNMMNWSSIFNIFNGFYFWQ